MTDLSSFFQAILFLSGTALLLFGLRLFRFFLYCSGVCLAFLAAPWLKSFLLFLKPDLTNEAFWLSILLLGLLLGFIFHKTYKISFYFACIASVFFALHYYTQTFGQIPFQNLLIFSAFIGAILSFFFRRYMTIFLSAAIGAIFVTSALPLLWKIQSNPLFLENITGSAKEVFTKGIHPAELYLHLYQLKNFYLFGTFPLALTLLSCCLQSFVTCRKVKD